MTPADRSMLTAIAGHCTECALLWLESARAAKRLRWRDAAQRSARRARQAADRAAHHRRLALGQVTP